MINTDLTKNTKEFFYDWMGGNEVIFWGINGVHNPTYDHVMQLVSRAGEYENFPYYAAAIAAWVLLRSFWKLITRQSVKYYLCVWLGVFAMLGVGFAANGYVIKSTKDYFAYPRPYVALASTGKVVKLEATEPRDDFRSFPSGHVAFTTFMVLALWPALTSNTALLGLAIIALMGWSRMALGMHFPADVFGAVLLTSTVMSIVGLCVYFVLHRILRIPC